MENSVLKVCSFYVSDWHLTAMLLPFIEEQIQKGESINTILEKSIIHNIKEIITRVQISDRIKEQIVKIDWTNNNLIKYMEIKNYLEKIIKNERNITIIIEGKKERIEYINNVIKVKIVFVKEKSKVN